MGITYWKHHVRDGFWKPLKLAVQCRFHPVVSLVAFRSLCCPSLTGWSWISHLTSLCLNFLICKMGIIIIISTSYDYNENERSKYYNLLSLSLSLSLSAQINRTCHVITFSRCWLPLGKGRNFWTILDTNLAIWALWSLSMGLTIIWHGQLRDWSIAGEIISFFYLTLCLWV